MAFSTCPPTNGTGELTVSEPSRRRADPGGRSWIDQVPRQVKNVR